MLILSNATAKLSNANTKECIDLASTRYEARRDTQMWHL